MRKFCPGTDTQPKHEEDLSEFTDDKNRSDGKAAYCKYCAAEKQRAWKRANADKVKAARKEYRDKKRRMNVAS